MASPGRKFVASSSTGACVASVAWVSNNSEDHRRLADAQTIVRKSTSLELYRPAHVAKPHFGGKPLNNFSTSLSNFFVSFDGLSGKASVAQPRQITCFVEVSKRSTTSVPTV